MSEPKIYSERLGAIGDAQFEAVASRMNLGRFTKAEPVTSGLFGQNVFVSTSEGEFVLRGAPHWIKGPDDTQWRREDRWQFTKEVFFARQLHEHTRAPVPWPMLHDEASDIFGWPYIVMPRMPGACFDERGIVKALAVEDRRSVAAALGRMLAEMQKLTWPFAGDFDTTIELQAYPAGDTRRVADETATLMQDAKGHGAITAEDMAWVAETARRALAVPGERPNTCVHGDYKLNNVTVMKDDGSWRVSGLFDLHEARFGDGALDIVRQACGYLDTEAALARVFVDAYREVAPPDPALGERLPLYIVNDRMKFWEFFTRPGNHAPWSRNKTFRRWAQPYLDGVLKLL
ncbi:MAG: aminoglycoside phosphotransferase family protein [Proteobacteria bacterium]|nr:aminoglycoside phosphotransferase family protein [Pseudomonadota bacterium]